MSTSFSSVCELFHHRCDSTPDADAMYGRRGGDWYTLKWKECGERARRIACGLHALGIEKGQRASILSTTRPEWVLADMGILCATGATTTIYPSNTPEECAYIVANSQSRFCFAENDEQVAKLVAERDGMPTLEKVIVTDGRPGHEGWVITLSELERLGEAWDAEHEGAYEERTAAVGPGDLATLIYTSGTTGKPKGVMLSHDCWVYEGEAIDAMGLLQASDKQYLFLPLAHSFAKVLEIAFIRIGVPTIVDGDIDALVPNMQAMKPTVMGAVPRIFEKVYNKVVSGAKDKGGVSLRIFKWAVQVGTEVSELRQRGQEPHGPLLLKYGVADRLVFSKLKDTFGGRIKFFISGGAPLSREIAEFFHASDILVLEGYGLTESSAASSVNAPDGYRFGSVGKPIPGTTFKIADDGEILIKGRGIMQGYFGLPEATSECLEPDGWLHTGDVGEIDEQGFCRITDRKKDIIVTAGGKNIAPQVIEGKIKARCQLVSQVVMHGDKRNFCVALVAMDEETAGKWARDHDVGFSDYADLATKQEIHDLIWQAIAEVNKELASYETIKYIHLLDHDLAQETGELTPTMKVKRRVVEANHQAVLDAFYADAMAAI